MRDLARLAAALVAALLLARNVAVAGGVQAMLVATGVVAAVVVAALTGWRDGLVTGAGVALGAHYVVALGYGDVAIDLAAPVVGALVVAFLDLADLAASLPPDRRRVDRALLRSSARHTAGIVAIGTTAAVAAAAVAAVPWPGSEVLRAAGALGVVAAVVTPMLLLRRAESAPPGPAPATPRPGGDRLRSRSAR